MQLVLGCTIERAEEKVLAEHANGVKKTSIWVYPDGEILKRNEWYTDGIKELEIPYKDGVPHGDFKRWTGFGDVALLGHYKKGLKDGKWTALFSDKKVEAYLYYENDHPVGDWEGWHFNRERSFEEHYNDDGLAVGIWKKWYDNGALQQEGDCHAKWDPKREIASAPAGRAKVKGKNAEDPDSSYLRRYTKDCHLLEEFTCKNGRLDGPFSLYYESYGETVDSANCGTGRIRVQGVLGKGATGKDSALIGTVTYFRADGTPMKQEHWNKDGKRDSVWRWFDERGNLVRECDLRVSGVVYGACEGNMSKFCAETSYVGEIGSVLDSSNLAQSVNFEQSIGKFPTTIRYVKPGRLLLYEEYWKNGQIAESRSFFPDSMGGKLASECFWKVDPKDGLSKRNGIMRNWYKSGVLMDSLTYVNGERVGEQFSYDSTGKLTIHKTEAGKNRPVIMHLLGEQAP
ncbi:hypothetical protein [Fibrobacter sp.]|uniref:toxin-antitoxin system YwqK family antitoxin n=1 Tax=Fibrobacter sp. TaxID=35828 RepID=UPI0026248883|nr:hypothetical protein [Fibrobacter sp.]MDD5943567.1 hypothetical protein [Fibrobacter sp.]